MWLSSSGMLLTPLFVVYPMLAPPETCVRNILCDGGSGYIDCKAVNDLLIKSEVSSPSIWLRRGEVIDMLSF